MTAADGDILRLRPAEAALDARALERLAEIAERFADGAILLTRRAKIELRGLGKTRQAIAALVAAGLIETPAQSGLPDRIISPATDLDSNADARLGSLLQHLDSVLKKCPVAAELPDKFAIAIDGGGVAHIGWVAADIRLDALSGQPGWWRLAMAGDAHSAAALGVLPAENAPAAVATFIAHVVAASGIAAHRLRFRDLDPAQCRVWAAAAIGTVLEPPDEPIGGRPSTELEQRRTAGWQSAGFVFGRIEAAALHGLADLARRHGPIRLLPDRSIVVPDASPASCDRLTALGAIVSDTDPRASIEACVGRRGCPYGSTDTREHALLCSRALPNLRAAATRAALHVSGCTKGCAHRRPAAVTLVGRNGRYDVVFAGGPAAAPRWHGLRPSEVPQRLADLDRAFVERAEPGESAEAFVARYMPAAD
ncbi:hypothetical protein V5738_08650 [Salinisphaera sp. SPP-AMP-43]|uniref:hypothetical protein n=1 Tax=Salinisphaera sp. SPP-AMP-43 TaxID=3121288 RepID=UPI003C6E1A98